MTSANKTLSANKTFRFDFSPSIVKLIDEFAFTHGEHEPSNTQK
jgi:hypothetical protein